MRLRRFFSTVRILQHDNPLVRPSPITFSSLLNLTDHIGIYRAFQNQEHLPHSKAAAAFLKNAESGMSKKSSQCLRPKAGLENRPLLVCRGLRAVGNMMLIYLLSSEFGAGPGPSRHSHRYPRHRHLRTFHTDPFELTRRTAPRQQQLSHPLDELRIEINVNGLSPPSSLLFF